MPQGSSNTWAPLASADRNLGPNWRALDDEEALLGTSTSFFQHDLQNAFKPILRVEHGRNNRSTTPGRTSVQLFFGAITARNAATAWNGNQFSGPYRANDTILGYVPKTLRDPEEYEKRLYRQPRAFQTLPFPVVVPPNPPPVIASNRIPPEVLPHLGVTGVRLVFSPAPTPPQVLKVLAAIPPVLPLSRVIAPVIAAAGTTLTATGIASSEAFGVGKLTETLNASGIASTEAFGTGTITDSGVTPPSGGGRIVYGTPHRPSPPRKPEWPKPVLLPVALVLHAKGISSGEVFGQGKLAVTLHATGLASTEAFGRGRLSVSLHARGIGSEERAGVGALNMRLRAAGIRSEERMGTPVLDARYDDAEDLLLLGG